MKTLIKAAAFAATLAAIPAVLSGPASAATDFSITLGNVAFGYSDGYWDRDHHWHKWHNRNEARWWREHHHDAYWAHSHDRDRDHGWRDNRWWDQH